MSFEVTENMVEIKKIGDEWLSIGDNYPLPPITRANTLKELLVLLYSVGYDVLYLIGKKEIKRMRVKR